MGKKVGKIPPKFPKDHGSLDGLNHQVCGGEMKNATFVRALILSIASVVLAGCTSTGVVSMGQDTYMIAGMEMTLIRYC